jgi:hypothetical protein
MRYREKVPASPFATVREYTVDLRYNVMKGTEYFMSL